MKTDSRLSSMLHVLLHMAQHDRPRTSEDLARMLKTNPVVVRRTLAGLREAGLVAAEKGHGGGWRLARAPAGISLLDVHLALGAPALFALGHRQDRPGCRVEAAVNAALDGTLAEAEALIRARLAAITLDALLARLPEDHPHA